MQQVKKVNVIYLATALCYLAMNLLPVPFRFLRETMVGQLLYTQGILLLPGAYYLIQKKEPLRDALRIHKLRIGNALLLLLLAALLSPVMTLVNALSMLATDYTISESMTEMSQSAPFLAMLFAVAIVPAVFEETVYRGVFFAEYSKVSPRWGVVLSALLFGMMHGNFNQFSYAFLLGMAFALCIEATDTILSSVLLHFLFNGSSVCLLYLLGKMETLLAGTEYEQMFSEAETVSMTLPLVLQMYLLPAIICSVLAFLVFRCIAKNCGRWEVIQAMFKKSEGETRFRSFFTAPLVAAIVVLFALMVTAEILF